VPTSASKSLDLLEERVETLLGKLGESEKARRKLADKVEVLEENATRQAGRMERLEKKVSVASEDLDANYLKKRDQIQSRINHLLARLESL
jgi:predicted  nucleic acid-binding Zn-ribbon protein